MYNKQTVPPGQILGLCRRTAGLRQVRLRLYGWQPREFEGLVLYFGATEVYKQRVWNPRGAEIVDYLRPFDLCQSLDGLEFDDVASVEAREVCPVACLQPRVPVIDVHLVLPHVRDGVPLELQLKRVGIGRFKEAVAESVVNPHGTAHYDVGFGIVFHVGNSISNLDSQCVEVCLRPGCRRGGGLEETSSSSRTERIVQRDANGWREANVILRSGNAPVAERSGCPTSKARSLAKQGRKRPRESPADRSL